MSLVCVLRFWILIAARLSLGQQQHEHCSRNDAWENSQFVHRHLLQSRFDNESAVLRNGSFLPNMPIPPVKTEPELPDSIGEEKDHPSNSRVQRVMPAGKKSESKKFREGMSRYEHEQKTSPTERAYYQFRKMLVKTLDKRLALIFLIVFIPSWFCILFCVMLIIGQRVADTGRRPNQDLGSGLTPSIPREPARNLPAPLCKQLVSPDTDQCSISVPSLAGLHVSEDALTFDIVSKVGKPIVQVQVRRLPELDGQATVAVEKLELRASKLQNLLGSCELHISHQQVDAQPQVQCLIYNGAGERFATLTELTSEEMATAFTGIAGLLHGGQKLFLLSSFHPSGWSMLIQGNIAERSITVLNKKKGQISVVMPGGNMHFTSAGRATPSEQYYKLRIQPGVDGGSVLIALLAIDRWPGSHEPAERPVSESVLS
mmetsp:Transcript_60863/g.108139  ORF Transcript_60863/g.108139 Transcript_60863/m.108139 type:complete len:430 (+) Transcript_60863:145-1434(+)